MPTYEYQCLDCGEHFDVVQSFKDKPLKVHASCGGGLQKVFHASGVVFKGSGYYVTDSRSSTASTSSGGSDSTPGSGSNGGSSNGPSESKSAKADKPEKTASKKTAKKSDQSSAAAD